MSPLCGSVNSPYTCARVPRRQPWLLPSVFKGACLTVLVLWAFIYFHESLSPPLRIIIGHVQRQAQEAILTLDNRWRRAAVASEQYNGAKSPVEEETVARFVVEQVVHAANVYSLIEGCGVPVVAVFNSSKAWNLANEVAGEYQLEALERRAFRDDILELSFEAERTARKMSTLSHMYITDLGDGGFVRRQLQGSLKRLQIVQRYRRFLEDNPHTPWLTRITIAEQIDKAISSLPQDLVRALSTNYKNLSPQLQRPLPFVENVSRTGEQVLQTFERELGRIEHELAQTPWYDTWRIYQIFGPSKFQQLREYLDVLKSREADIRYQAEGVITMRENLHALEAYVDWYSTNMPRIALDYHPTNLRSLDQEVWAVDMALAQLLEEAASTNQFLTNYFVLGRTPRRIMKPELGLPSPEDSAVSI